MASTTKGNENLMGAATYLLGFITGILFLVIEKDSKFIRFHAMQSTIVFGGLFLASMVGMVPILGWFLGFALSIVAMVLWILLMWKAFQGEMYKLPFVGDLAEQQLKKIK